MGIRYFLETKPFHPQIEIKPPPANETPREILLERDVTILFNEVRSLREEIGVLKAKLKSCKC